VSVDRHLGHALPQHQNLVRVTANNALALFCGDELTNAPLWVRLVRRSSGGLRQVSADWLSAADNLLNRLGLESTATLVERTTQDPFLAYRLGQHGLAERLAANESLLFRIAIARGAYDNLTLSELKNKFQNGSEAESLFASFLVQQAKRGRAVTDGDLEQLEQWVTASNSSVRNDDALARICHVLNSLNYVWLRRGDLARLEPMIESTESVASKVSDADLKNHILGNAFFHRSIIEKLKGNQDQELSHLRQAVQLDQGFTDYDYRIAQILHDKQDAAAKAHYEAAIQTGPFNHALVNDYGVFLSEFGTQDELKSWEAVATFFFQPVEKGESA